MTLVRQVLKDAAIGQKKLGLLSAAAWAYCDGFC